MNPNYIFVAIVAVATLGIGALAAIMLTNDHMHPLVGAGFVALLSALWYSGFRCISYIAEESHCDGYEQCSKEQAFKNRK